MIFVESRVPPRPVSNMTISQRFRLKYSIQIAVTSSNSVGLSFMDSADALTCVVTSASSASVIGSP